LLCIDYSLCCIVGGSKRFVMVNSALNSPTHSLILKTLVDRNRSTACHENQIVDPCKFEEDTKDIHRMMSAVRAMFLHLEHHNEAMLRVSVEIVTCPEARKCLRWDDEWFSDDGQREAFRETIQEKIKIARREEIKIHPRDDASGQAIKLSSEQEEELQRALLERQEAQEETADCKARIAELEAQVTRLRASMRANMRDNFMVNGQKGQQASDNSEGCGGKEGAQDCSKRRFGDSQGQDSAKMEGKKHFCDAEAQCLVEQVNLAVEAGAVELRCSECNEISRKLEICKAQLASDASRRYAAENAAGATQEHSGANSKSASEKAEKGHKKNRILVTDDEDLIAGESASRAAAASSADSSWADKSSELARANRTLAQRDAEIVELKERMHGMSRTLFQLKQSLQKLKDIAEARGFGRLVEEAMAESNVNKILEDPEYPIYIRLYEDARRRQRKAKLLDQQILGHSSSSPALLAAVRPPSRLQPGSQAEPARQAGSNVVVQSRPGTPTRLLEGSVANSLNPLAAPVKQSAVSAMMMDLQPLESKTVSSSSPSEWIVQPELEQPVQQSVQIAFQQPFSDKILALGLDHRLPRTSSTPNLKSHGKRMLERKGLPGVRSGLPCLLGGPSASGKLTEQLKASRRHWPSKDIIDFEQSKTLSVDWQTDTAPLCGRAPLVTVSLSSASEARR